MRDARIKPPRPDRLTARELLVRWMVRGRMTQGEAADQIGISRVKLNQYLNSRSIPCLETAVRIEDATGIQARLWLEDEPAAAVAS